MANSRIFKDILLNSRIFHDPWMILANSRIFQEFKDRYEPCHFITCFPLFWNAFKVDYFLFVLTCYIKNNLLVNLYIIGILHEGAERRSVLHEAGQTWWTNPKGEFTRFDQAECNTLLRSAPECCIPFNTCHFVILPT